MRKNNTRNVNALKDELELSEVINYGGKVIDLTDKTFGRLTVLERAENNTHNKAYWVCQCECGNISIVQGGHLRSGASKSCGCLPIEKLVDRSTTHGMYTREKHPKSYMSWANMINRCIVQIIKILSTTAVGA